MFWRKKQAQQNPVDTEVVDILIHTLRTPLSAIRFINQTLLGEASETLNERHMLLLKKSEEYCLEIQSLTESVLLAKHKGESLASADFEPGSIEDLLFETIETFDGQLKKKHILLRTKFAPDARVCNFSYALLRDVMRNLIENAIKYTPEDGTITISTDYTQNAVSIVVADTGIGVDEASSQSLFNKYVRSSRAKEIDKHGLGLGLYIAKQTIQSHRGTLEYSPNTPNGAIFTIVLPLSL
jgi:K+-sensing histidine kinase KdpD